MGLLAGSADSWPLHCVCVGANGGNDLISALDLGLELISKRNIV